MEVRPFYDKQIALLETFANQAAIAIENIRLFESGKQRRLALTQANRDLAEREAKIQRLVDSNIIGIFTWDFDGRILEANEAFLRIVGYDHEDLVAGGLRWTDHLTAPEWRDQDTRLIREIKATGTLQPFEKEYLRKDGRPVPVLIGVALEKGGDQGVAFVLDLTERKRAEERLRVQHTVARILAEAATIEEVSPRIWASVWDGTWARFGAWTRRPRRSAVSNFGIERR
jgi:PAS domain S-box-containing protein